MRPNSWRDVEHTTLRGVAELKNKWREGEREMIWGKSIHNRGKEGLVGQRCKLKKGKLQSHDLQEINEEVRTRIKYFLIKLRMTRKESSFFCM